MKTRAALISFTTQENTKRYFVAFNLNIRFIFICKLILFIMSGSPSNHFLLSIMLRIVNRCRREVGRYLIDRHEKRWYNIHACLLVLLAYHLIKRSQGKERMKIVERELCML